MVPLNPTAASILGFLAGDGPMTGWDLARHAESTIGPFWNVTRSQIYRELRDLAGRGLVAAGEAGPRDRTPYEITHAGREAFSTWVAGDPGADLIRHRLLLTVFFADHIPPRRLGEILAEQRAAHRDQLSTYRQIERSGVAGARAAALAFGIAYEEMVLSWLDDVAHHLAVETSRSEVSSEGR